MYHIKGKNKREIHLGTQGNRITLVFIEENEENCCKCQLASEHKKSTVKDKTGGTAASS